MVSMKITVTAVTLVTLCILATNTCAAEIYISCCQRYMPGKLKLSEIKGFSLQNRPEMCPIRAIIFHTKKGKKCANPALTWVMDYVARIQNLAHKTQMAGQGPDRIATGYVKQREYITEKVHQEAEPQPEDSLALVSDKIIEDGPLPMKMCKW